ncbi:hypothetical protein Tco_0201118 [Tanacetum coccineum]
MMADNICQSKTNAAMVKEDLQKTDYIGRIVQIINLMVSGEVTLAPSALELTRVPVKTRLIRWSPQSREALGVSH